MWPKLQVVCVHYQNHCVNYRRLATEKPKFCNHAQLITNVLIVELITHSGFAGAARLLQSHVSLQMIE